MARSWTLEEKEIAAVMKASLKRQDIAKAAIKAVAESSDIDASTLDAEVIVTIRVFVK